MSIRSWEWNPIIVREYRARWRGWSAFALLLGYVAVLALAFLWRYAEAAGQSSRPGTPLVRMEVLGAQLFLTLIWMQSFAWALIGPAITATSIAAEREAGMLEAVQLSPLSPARIVFGKLVSALSLIGLLLLVSTPITASCFLMGGVAPEDFLAATALHATTAFFGAVLGLTCSAWSRRANASLRSSYALVIGWLVGSLISFAVVSIAPATGSKMNWLLQAACTLFGWSNPILATAAIADRNALGTTPVPAAWGVFEASPWLISIGLQLTASAVLLCSATRALHRPFGEQYWLGQKNSAPKSETTGAGSTPGAPAREKTTALNLRSEWISLPFFSRLTFFNPVLQRETRGKFRMRQPPAWVLAFEIVLGMFVAYFYLIALKEALLEPEQREMIWWIIAFIGLTVVAISAAVSGANAFTRERELKTWEGLRLSLLSPDEIIGAKLGATLIGFAVFSLPFWPLLLPCIDFSGRNRASFDNGVTPAQAISCVLIILVTGTCYTMWGMYWSWRCRKTSAAVGWSLGSLFFTMVFVPVFLTANSGNEEIFWSFHPFVALAMVTENDNSSVVIGTIIFLMTVAGVLWLKLRSELHNELHRQNSR